MIMRTCFALLACAVVLGGCSGAPPIDWEPAPGAPAGYRLADDDVIFRFYPDRYEHVTRNESGEWIAMTDMTVGTATVAGEFNEWNRETWPMKRCDEGWWELKMARTDFGDATTLQFKFVVNEWYWVEPGEDVLNRTPTGFANESWNLELILP